MATGFFLKDVRAARTNIYIIVRIAGQRYKKSTGIMIDPKFWNSTTQTIRDTKELPSAKVFINRLKEWRQAADTVCDGIMAGAAIPLPDEFWARVVEIMGGSPEAPASQLFGYYFKTYIERRRADHGCRNTLKKYITAYNRFCEFERDTHRHYRFADINMRFYEKYRAYILSRGYVSNYFGMLVSCIKVVYREAREVDHLHNLHETELRGFSTPFTTSKSIYLSTDELRAMADVEITPEALVAMDPALAKLSAPKMRLKVEALRLVRNKFLLGAYTPLRVADFAWDRTGAAYAAHVVERDGKYYYFISTNGSGIGVAVADRPEGSYRDAIGRPLLTNEDCFDATHSWVCIDPAVFIDDDGQAWIFWGNKVCYCARLKRNMTEIDGPIKRIDRKEFDFTEAPWVHKYNGKYYLTFATGWPEKIAYAMSDRPDGPYEYKGIISEIAGNSNTTHPSIVEFRGKWYFFTHNGGLPDGTSYSRSVCLEPLEYNADGTIRKIHHSTESIFGK